MGSSDRRCRLRRRRSARSARQPCKSPLPLPTCRCARGSLNHVFAVPTVLTSPILAYTVFAPMLTEVASDLPGTLQRLHYPLFHAVAVVSALTVCVTQRPCTLSKALAGLLGIQSKSRQEVQLCPVIVSPVTGHVTCMASPRRIPWRHCASHGVTVGFQVVKAVWAYAKQHRLQDPNDGKVPLLTSPIG